MLLIFAAAVCNVHSLAERKRKKKAGKITSPSVTTSPHFFCNDYYCEHTIYATPDDRNNKTIITPLDYFCFAYENAALYCILFSLFFG